MPVFAYTMHNGKVNRKIIHVTDEPSMNGEDVRLATHVITHDEAKLSLDKIALLYPGPCAEPTPPIAVQIVTEHVVE